MLYIHIPFCRQACHYCNFHFSTSLKYEDEMITALAREMEMRIDFLKSKKLTSVYIGGGTPSIISTTNLKYLFNAIHSTFEVMTNAEVTLEANPEDISKENLKTWKEVGINRLSLGVQSFHDQDLDWMNRIHDADAVSNALNLIQEANIEYSLDLIFGTPGLTKEMWIQNLHTAIELKPSHISAYALTVENKTALHSMVQKGQVKESPPELISEQFYIADELLEKAGYLHYEISNYALPGKEAVHNSNYWDSKEYLGIGPSAHSYNGTLRSWNISSNAQYLSFLSAKHNPSTHEELTPFDQINEYLMTRLRTSKGMNIQDWNQRFAASLRKEPEEMINKKLKSGEMISDGENYKLNKTYLFTADSVISDLFAIEDSLD